MLDGSKIALSRSKNERVRKLSAPFALYLYYINSDGGNRTCFRDLFSLCLLRVATKSGKPGLDMLNCRKTCTTGVAGVSPVFRSVQSRNGYIPVPTFILRSEEHTSELQ